MLRASRVTVAALALGLGASACAAQSRGAAGESALHATRVLPQDDAVTRALMVRLAALSADSMQGRGAGTEGGARARGWIERELRSIGAAPLGADFEQPVTIVRRTGSDLPGANVVARIPGRDPRGPAIVLSAHYDHLGTRDGVIFNGADDDASGCVAVLAIAERIKRAPLEHDVILAFFDGEEVGLVGSRAFVRTPPVPLARIAVNVNLDMVGRQDGGALWVAGATHYPVFKRVVEAVAARASVTVRQGHDTRSLKPDDDWTNASDHGSFHAKGIPFLYLGVEDHADYHKPGDDAEKVDPRFFRGVTDFAEALVRAVDRAIATLPVRPEQKD